MDNSIFHNWSKKDFTYTWGNIPYTFKSGESYGLDDFSKVDRPAIAKHFAKHLADRELQSIGLLANDIKAEEFINRALTIPQVEEIKESSVCNSEVDESQDEYVIPKVSRGRHRKTE